MKICAYCGTAFKGKGRDHVIPGGLYPASKATSRVQRLTVPAYGACNNAWSDDEAHFRNVLLLAGEQNDACRERWGTTARRSFREQADGKRRVADLAARIVPVQTAAGERHKIYPGQD